MELPAGLFRPIVAVVLVGTNGKRRLLDGLLDTGADRTFFPIREAQAVGLTLSSVPDGTVKTAGGISIPYYLSEATLELRGDGNAVRWRTQVAFAPEPMCIIHLGTRGFLEYFHTTFRGPERTIMLQPTASLPGII